jgi:hypothetical protein
LFAHSPKIVTDGLVLSLDAGNTKSYPGTGTTWYDKSGRGNNFTTYNSPVFSNNGFTNFVTNEYLETSNTNWAASIPTGSADRTIMAIFTTPSASVTSIYNHIFHYGDTVQYNAYGLAIVSSPNTAFFALSNHTWSSQQYANYVLSSNTTYIAAVRFKNSNSPKNNYFINGQFPSTAGADYNINTGITYSPRIGVRISGYAESLRAGGFIYNIMMYNRYLTDSELLQNYNSLRGRFGI